MKLLAAFPLLIAGTLTAHALPLRTLPDLNSVTVWETTFATTANTFAANDPALITRLGDPLTSSNRDFSYYPEEYYDVFYSNAGFGDKWFASPSRGCPMVKAPGGSHFHANG